MINSTCFIVRFTSILNFLKDVLLPTHPYTVQELFSRYVFETGIKVNVKKNLMLDFQTGLCTPCSINYKMFIATG